MFEAAKEAEEAGEAPPEESLLVKSAELEKSGDAATSTASIPDADAAPTGETALNVVHVWYQGSVSLTLR